MSGPNSVVLGIDTSNYTTSCAVIGESGILADTRIPLKVKQGERGLRQSDALYQHWNNLPELLKPLLSEYRTRITAVCASARPRPYEDSYMPVFNAGKQSAEIIASSLGVPLKLTSHQEGHILAAAEGNDIDFTKPLLCAHLSGGTLEVVLTGAGRYELVGGTADISYGQLIDRMGVAMGLSFPAGKALDSLAVQFAGEPELTALPKVFKRDGKLNLSGLETRLSELVGKIPDGELAYICMTRVSESFVALINELKDKTRASQVLVTGGVASSRFLRSRCEGEGYMFGRPELCPDNAVGVAKAWLSDLSQSHN